MPTGPNLLYRLHRVQWLQVLVVTITGSTAATAGMLNEGLRIRLSVWRELGDSECCRRLAVAGCTPSPSPACCLLQLHGGGGGAPHGMHSADRLAARAVLQHLPELAGVRHILLRLLMRRRRLPGRHV